MTAPNPDPTPKPRVTPIVSLRARDGTMIEMLFRPKDGKSTLAAYRDGLCQEHNSLTTDGNTYVPYSANNNLLTHRVIALASSVGPFGSPSQLIADVRAFIHRYVDVTPAFEEVAAHYVLMTWGYDAFNELPYLRARGQYGSGKSRFLLTIGSICYKPIFASGASTISPIFRLIDQVGGTLVIDEADFWASDERSEIVKILNNGNARGFPVLRSDVTPSKEFNPRAFNIFGPKLVATRHPFEDIALESRCLTEVLGNRRLRPDIPISLPHTFDVEAEALRNRLLAYRFHHFAIPSASEAPSLRGMSPRRAQILAPLLAVASDDESRARLRAFVEGTSEIFADGKAEVERCVLVSVKALLGTRTSLTLAAIATQFLSDWQHRYGLEISHRWIGSVLRRLGVAPQKSNGMYLIGPSEYPRLRQLIAEHDLGDVRDIGDVGDALATASVR